MNKKTWKVNELTFSNIATLNLSYINDAGVTVSTMFTSDEIEYATRSYYDYWFLDYTGSLKADVLKNNWAKWFEINAERINRIYRALDEKYNPTENYLKHGNVETTYGHVIDTKTNSGERTITTIPNEIVSTVKERASDSGTLTATAETTTHATSGVGGTSNSSAYEDTNKETNSGKDIIIDTTHGNIGTTLASTMILEEMKIRRDSLLDMIVSDFMYENSYYIEEDLF